MTKKSECGSCENDSPHPSAPGGSDCPTKPKPHRPPVDLCEYKELEHRYLLRKEEGDCPLILVFGEAGAPCWYRLCVLADGETPPEEDGVLVIYDCLRRPWKLQEGKGAADVAALQAQIAALEATIQTDIIPCLPQEGPSVTLEEG